MSVFIRSLVGRVLTIDSVNLPAFGLQERGNVTAAIQAALDAKTINMWAAGGDVKPKASLEEYTPVTTDVISLPGYAETVLVTPAGTIAALTINMPATPADGQRVNLVFDQAVTALTQQIASGSGHTLKGALTAATAKGFGEWQFRLSNKTWYRVG